jgi:flagellar FliL protein
MSEEKKDGQAVAGSGKSVDIKKILTLVFAVVNIGVGASGLVMTFKGTIGWSNPKITEDDLKRQIASEAPADMVGPFIYTMDKFTVNLGGEPKRMIRLEVNLELLDHEGFEEIINTENRARARDRIVDLLNSKTFSDVETLQGKLFLKENIAFEINQILPRGSIKDIYFTEFVVQ